MVAKPDPPSIQLIEAEPEHATVIDGFAEAFHRHESVNITAAARRASIDSLLHQRKLSETTRRQKRYTSGPDLKIAAATI